MAKDKGFEYLDDTPVEVPVKLRRKDSWTDMVQHVAAELSRRNAERGEETLEDMLDFDEESDDVVSPSELRYMKEEELLQDAVEAAKIRSAQYRAAKMKKELDRYGNKKRVDERRDQSDSKGSDDAVQKPEKKGG